MYRCEIWVLTLTEEQTECSQYSDLAMDWGIQGSNSDKSRRFFSYCEMPSLAAEPTQATVEGVM